MVVTAVLALLAFAGEDCSTVLEQARALYEQRQYPLAVARFEQARVVCPESPAVLLGLAQTQFMALRLDDAMKTLDATLASSPRMVEALKLKGDIQYLIGREYDAVHTFEAALEIDPAHEATMYALGRVYYQLNRFPAAQKLFTAIVERNPRNFRAHDNLALCFAAQGQESEALKHFLKALDLVSKDHPEYDTVYANAANFFLEHDQPQKAFQLAAEAAKRNPASARNMYLTGKALAALEKYDLSVRWFRQAVELEPTYQEACYWLWRVERKLGNSAEADRALARFKELSAKPQARR